MGIPSRSWTFDWFGSCDYEYGRILASGDQKIHEEAIRKLESYGYIVEVSSDFDHHTTSYDGFILATASSAERIFKTFHPVGRTEIISGTPPEMIKYLRSVID